MLQEEKSYMGIDVSKTTLDVHILPCNKFMQFTNDSQGIRKLLDKAKKFPNIFIVLESTGGYEKQVSQALIKANLAVCMINPRRIRDFAKSLGKLAKTDKIDAYVIALFASKVPLQSNVFHNEEQDKLSANNARRQQLLDMITAENNRLDKASPEQKESIQRVLDVLKKELKTVELSQKQIIEANETLLEQKKILSSIKGIGDTTATAILCELPEIGTLTAKQIASLAGLAPFNRDSGTLKGKRTIWGGRASVRKALFMATLVATRHNPQILYFYQRLCAAGKAKMTALIACMRKILIIMNALIKKRVCWNFQHNQLP